MRSQHERDKETRRVRDVLAVLRADNLRRHRSARRSVRDAYGARPRCVYCGGSGGTADHVMPQALGGGHLIGNLVPCCKSCNGAKGARPPAVYFASCPKAARNFLRWALHAAPEFRDMATAVVDSGSKAP